MSAHDPAPGTALADTSSTAPRPAPGTGPADGAAPRSLVVKATSGAERAEACNQAFTVAAAAVAAGAQVSLWLTGEASWFAVPGRAELDLEHAAPVADLLQVVLAEGTVTVCTQCALRRGLTADDVLPGVRIAGAAAFVAETLRPGAQALVY
jgi:predicted peroxiredoxin